MWIRGEIEGIQGLADEPGSEGEEANPDRGSQAPGSAGGEEEEGQEKPERKEVDRKGKEEVVGRAAPVVASVYLGLDGRLDDPKQVERGKAHGDEYGSYQGFDVRLRNGIQSALRWWHEIKLSYSGL